MRVAYLDEEGGVTVVAAIVVLVVVVVVGGHDLGHESLHVDQSFGHRLERRDWNHR